MSETDAFADDVGELLSARIKRFAAWAGKDWRLDPKDRQAMKDLDLTPEQIEGWNRCCDSLEGAAFQWLEEWPAS
jgi:hypothetical protein